MLTSNQMKAISDMHQDNSYNKLKLIADSSYSNHFS